MMPIIVNSTTRTFEDYDGTLITWYYSAITNQCTHVVIGPEEPEPVLKTKKKYYNPANGRMVGYARARELKLI